MSAIPHARPLLRTPLDHVVGWVAVSATDLTSAERAQLAWLRSYCPVGQLGASILLYYFESPPAAEPGPADPLGIAGQETGVSASAQGKLPGVSVELSDEHGAPSGRQSGRKTLTAWYWLCDGRTRRTL